MGTALSILQAVATLRWLGARRTPFTPREFAKGAEIHYSSAFRWLSALHTSGDVDLIGWRGTTSLWMSALKFERRGTTYPEKVWWLEQSRATVASEETILEGRRE